MTTPPTSGATRAVKTIAVKAVRRTRRTTGTVVRRARKTGTKLTPTSVPKTPTEARAQADRLLDQRILPHAARRAALVRAWTLRAKTEGALPGDHATLLTQTLGLGRRLARKGHLDDAIAVYAATEAVMGDDASRAQLLVQRSALELRQGIVPPDLRERTVTLLREADRSLAAGDRDAAGTRLQEAFNLDFHRTLHFEDIPSVLSQDVEGFLAPYRASTTYAEVIRPTERTRPAQEPVLGRPHRLLVTTFFNWNFVNDIVADYRQTAGVEVRTIDLKEIPDGPWRAQPVDLVKDRLHQVAGTGTLTPPPSVREAFDWADTIFVEWGHRALPWVSMLPDVRAKVVARLHSYEAFTPMPMHTDWTGIDDMVFVSPHIRALVEASVPEIHRARLHTIPNRNLLGDFRRPKTEDAAYTLGLVGWNNVTKDPLWTVEVLEHLRRHDDRWKLLLLGHDFPKNGLTQPAVAYRDTLHAHLAALGDAIERPGFTDDVPEALRRIGVIVSSSRREGTHEGLIQGVASGSYPLVRNWPYVAAWGGPATMFPQDWIVETPEQAASKLLEATAQVSPLEAAEGMAEWAYSTYDWSVVRPQLDDVLFSPR